MSTNTLLEARLHKHGTAEAAGCLLTIPIILGVCAGVNLFIGDSQLPRELVGTTPWFVAATVLTGLLAGWFWKRNQIRLAFIEKDGERYLEIYDPAHPLVLQGPFTVAYGWTTIHQPKVGNQTVLVVGVYQDGQLEVSLTETWGTLYTPPHGWPGGFSLQGGPAARRSYASAGGSFLPELVNLMVPY